MRVTFVILLGCVLVVRLSYADATSDLFSALEENKPAEALAALERGANARAKNEAGETPLHIAARTGNGIVIERLLRAGADVDARNALGQTPLHVASAYGHQMEVTILLGFGADPDIVDGEGLGARHLAEDNGETDVATLLATPEALATLRGPRVSAPPSNLGRFLVPAAALAVVAIAAVRGSN